jgi:tetratricopeptide (TPR) repeat protein
MTMNDSQSPKPRLRWYQFSLRTLLIGLLVISGCGPSKGEKAMDVDNEQQAVDAFNRGVAYYAKGELDEAIAGYTEAIRLNPKGSEAYQTRGLAYLKKGDPAKAAADLAKAKELRCEPE